VKAFFDISMLVGAFYGDHPRHAACLRLLEDAFKKTHSCAAHAVTELYAVMTRLPVRPRITPEQSLLFVENVRDNLSVVTLSAAEQLETAAEAARRRRPFVVEPGGLGRAQTTAPRS
jgi:predicted nucleic acid-binding protein